MEGFVYRFATSGYPSVHKARETLFGNSDERLLKFLKMMMIDTRPFTFTGTQQDVYATLAGMHAFVDSGIKDHDIDIYFSGISPYSGRVVKFDGFIFLSILFSFLVGTYLYDRLISLCEVPHALCKAILFHQHSEEGDVFCMREWFAARFFVANSAELASWTNQTYGILQTPDYLDLVYMHLTDNLPLAYQSQEVIVTNEHLQRINTACTIDTSVDLMERCTLRSTARDLLTFYSYVMHRMAELTNCGLNLKETFIRIRPLFEPCMAMLLGTSDPSTISIIARLDTTTLTHLGKIAEDMRRFLANRSAPDTPPLLPILQMRQHDTESMYLSMVHSTNAVVSKSNGKPIEPTYAPLTQLSLTDFYEHLVKQTQVLQLHQLTHVLPQSLSQATLEKEYGVWRLPSNVRTHRLQISIQFYKRVCAPLINPGEIFVGHDTVSPYIVGRRATIHLTEVAMLIHSARSRNFVKTAAFFPLLARLYTICYAFGDDNQMCLTADRFARNAFVQILARWLLIPMTDIMHSVEVPPPDSGLAFSLLCSVHRVFQALWPASDSDSMFFARLTALRNFMIMDASHWIQRPLLLEIETALMRLPANAWGESQHVVKAVCMHHTFIKYGQVAAPHTGKEIGCLSNGALPLRVRMDVNFVQILELLANNGGGLRKCKSDLECTRYINACFYDCILALPAPLCCAALLGMQTKSAALSDSSWFRAIYSCPDHTIDEWAAQPVGTLCAEQSPCTLYNIRAGIAHSELLTMFTILQKLERLVCVKAKRSRQMDYLEAAQCLGRFYSEEQSPHFRTPVSTYIDADRKMTDVVYFDSGICLVNLPLKDTNDNELRPAIKRARHTYGDDAVFVSDRAVNVISSIYDCYTPECAQPSYSNATLARVMNYKAGYNKE